ncbi:hypothetical protein ACJX0J_016821 [Zea mays]
MGKILNFCLRKIVDPIFEDVSENLEVNIYLVAHADETHVVENPVHYFMYAKDSEQDILVLLEKKSCLWYAGDMATQQEISIFVPSILFLLSNSALWLHILFSKETRYNLWLPCFVSHTKKRDILHCAMHFCADLLTHDNIANVTSFLKRRNLSVEEVTHHIDHCDSTAAVKNAVTVMFIGTHKKMVPDAVNCFFRVQDEL